MTEAGVSFRKSERLCGIRAITDLFSEGRAIYFPPLKAIYKIMPGEEGVASVRVLISVPKRNFKKAVVRNLLRRRIREAYRLNKAPLFTTVSATSHRIEIAILYSDEVIHPYIVIERGIKQMIEKLKLLM
jgi:ribonuclease P protein component